jgi:ABC-type multidrug transport system permease subunit
LLELINDLRTESQLTTLLTTHYLDEAERLGDRVAMMSAGRIVALGTPAGLLARLGNELIEIKVPDNAEPALAALRAHRLAGVEAFAVGSTITVPLRDGSSREAIAAIADLGSGRAASPHAVRVSTTSICNSPAIASPPNLLKEFTMTTIAASPTISARLSRPARPAALGVLATLSRRRPALSVTTKRELFVPLLTPLLFAVVIAPALAKMVSAGPGVDYRTYVSISTAGLLVPLACMFAGIGVIVDRQSGARRELLTAPIRRSLILVGNLVVAVAIGLLQLVALMVATVLRGAHFDATATGICWFAATAVIFAALMYAIAEIMANRISSQEEYIGVVPAVAIVPWFVAGSLFAISALPVGLRAIAKVLPLTHALALMRYGVVDRRGIGLHDIWGMTNPTEMAALSLAVLVGYAIVLGALALRVFRHAVSG